MCSNDFCANLPTLARFLDRLENQEHAMRHVKARDGYKTISANDVALGADT